jgi:hypothetical protein
MWQIRGLSDLPGSGEIGRCISCIIAMPGAITLLSIFSGIGFSAPIGVRNSEFPMELMS